MTTESCINYSYKKKNFQSSVNHGDEIFQYNPLKYHRRDLRFNNSETNNMKIYRNASRRLISFLEQNKPSSLKNMIEKVTFSTNLWFSFTALERYKIYWSI